MVDCWNCGAALPLPVEPLYSRESVIALVPVPYSTLARWISTNPGVLSTHYTGKRPKRRRMFTAHDIRLLRASLVHPTR